MIFYPKENHDISEYTLAIIASNNVFSYLLQHVLILKNLNIIFKKLIVADIGLLGDQRKTLIGILGDKIEFVDFKNKNFNTGFKTQSDQYRRIIDNRISFLKQLLPAL